MLKSMSIKVCNISGKYPKFSNMFVRLRLKLVNFGYFPEILTHNLIALFCIVADVLAASVMSGKLNGVAFKILLVSHA